MNKLISARTAPSGDDVEDKRLTLMLLMYKIHPPGLYKAQSMEFRFEASPIPRPADMTKEMSRSRHLGYYSLIQPDRITDFTCTVNGKTASGTISFKAPRLWQGQVLCRHQGATIQRSEEIQQSGLLGTDD